MMTLRHMTVSTLMVAGLGLAGAANAAQFKEFEDKCGAAPYGPEITMDGSIDDKKMGELRQDVLDFIKTSDQYQDCVYKTLEIGPKLEKSDPFEKQEDIKRRFGREGMKILDESQSEKERVGSDFNKLIDLRKKSAPK
jgi:hypothetical protein